MDVPRTLPRRSIAFLLLIVPLTAAVAITGILLEATSPAAAIPWSITPGIVALQLGVAWRFGLHRGVWRYTGLDDLLRVGLACAVSVAVVAPFVPLAADPVLALAALLLDGVFAGNAILGVRLLARLAAESRSRRARTRPVVVVGAGDAGEALVRALRRDPQTDLRPVAFVDDDIDKQGLRVHGVEVQGIVADLPRVTDVTGAEAILVAVAGAPDAEIRRLLEIAQGTGLPVKRVPNLLDLVQGRAAIHQLQDVTLEDLLPRDPIRTDRGVVDDLLLGQRVVVTGGAGSIGSELCRQIVAHRPARLVILDINENALFHLEHELRDITPPETQVVCALASVRDADAVEAVFAQHKPATVFHAAAYKHVPVLEHFPEQAVLNNVHGTRVVADAAHRHAAREFVLISTDKAVRPSSVMGTTKRVAELLVADLDRRSRTRFVTIRFGNVLGSNGSVLQLFRRQIARGGPVTVTHPDIKRYFMTIPEAVGLVLFAASMEDEGSTFILDMGEQVRILDMARHYIRLCGLEPDRDIAIEIVGLRPGEKLYEELWIEAEEPQRTSHRSILRAPRVGHAAEELPRAIGTLVDWAAEGDRAQVVAHLQQLVPEYTGDPVGLRSLDPAAVSDVVRQVREVAATAETLDESPTRIPQTV